MMIVSSAVRSLSSHRPSVLAKPSAIIFNIGGVAFCKPARMGIGKLSISSVFEMNHVSRLTLAYTWGPVPTWIR